MTTDEIPPWDIRRPSIPRPTSAPIPTPTASVNGDTMSSDEFREGSSWRYLFHNHRFLLLFICFLCLCSICSNYSIINLTFLCMRNETVVDPVTGIETRPFDYSGKQISLINGALAIGTIVGTFPINYLYIKKGAKYPFFFAGVISAIATALLPSGAYAGMGMLLILRFFQGIAYAADFAAIGIMTVRWAPMNQIGFFVAITTSFTAISPAVTNPVTGWLCESSLGWRWSYYFHAMFSVVVFALWLVFYNDVPSKNRFVSQKELRRIDKGKTPAYSDGDSFVPYWEICKNPKILIVWFNSFVEMCTVTFLISYSAIYFHDVLGFDTQTTGVLVAVAAVSHAPFKWTFGLMSDKIKCCSEKFKMCFFNTIAIGMVGVLCVVIAVLPQSWGVPSVAAFAGIYICMGANPGGFYKCGALVSRQFSHFVLATIQFMKCIALFVAPGAMAIFVPDLKDISQWRVVFIVYAVVVFIANFAFYFIVDDQPAAFTLLTKPETPAQTDQPRKKAWYRPQQIVVILKEMLDEKPPAQRQTQNQQQSSA